jgi:hypothetical protein
LDCLRVGDIYVRLVSNRDYSQQARARLPALRWNGILFDELMNRLWFESNGTSHADELNLTTPYLHAHCSGRPPGGEGELFNVQ